jgi:hypothetical protein
VHVQVINTLSYIIYGLNYTVVAKDIYRKYGFDKEIIQYTMSGCMVLASAEHKTKHDNTVNKTNQESLLKKKTS